MLRKALIKLYRFRLICTSSQTIIILRCKHMTGDELKDLKLACTRGDLLLWSWCRLATKAHACQCKCLPVWFPHLNSPYYIECLDTYIKY